MANPTSNFGWQMPTPIDLVTDLPADFEVFGQAVDTSLADLKGGTTGQILAKNSNTDMDFVWSSPNPGDITAVTAGTGISGGGTSGDVTITNSMATAITTNGDLIYGTGSGTFTRRGIGSTNQVLTVSGGVPTWVTPAGSTLAIAQIASGSLTSGSSLSISSLSSYDTIEFRASSVSLTGLNTLGLRINNNADPVYEFNSQVVRATPSFSAVASPTFITATANDQFDPMNNSQFDSTNMYRIRLTNCKATGFTLVSGSYVYRMDDSGARRETALWTGIYKVAEAVSSIQFRQIFGGTTFSAGSYVVWGG